jgi:hypothetical protein
VSDSREGPGGDEISRRNLIRLLVGLGIGIPVLIEALTLVGLVGDLFGGDDGTETPTGETEAPGVGVGDELLPSTAPSDTVAASYIAADGWTYTLTVGVDNGGDATYELRLRSVTTGGGTTVDGGGESDAIPPGESGTVTGRWDLPEGSSPATVEVVAVSRNGTVTTVEESVRIGGAVVRGG